MKPFRYGRDLLFLGACLLYALNRWAIKPLGGSSFFHGTFNDLLLIPAALPLVLWVQGRLGWRTPDAVPTWPEIAGHWLVWSLLSEVLLPLRFHHITGDWMDIVAYATGALLAGLWWSWFYSSRSDFNWIAPYYGWMERIAAGSLMQRSRTVFLSSLSGKVLLVGEGQGRCLEALLRCHPSLQVTCLDQSEKMLELTRKRLRRSGLEGPGVEYLCQDLLKGDLPADTYDGIITNYFLDCFEGKELERVVALLASSAKVRSRWLVADFQIPEKGWRRGRARVIVWLMIRFFRVAAGLRARILENPCAHLEKAGFVCRKRVEFSAGLVHADLWERGLGQQVLTADYTDEHG